MRLIGITGGIGAGKSVVSRILRLKGYHVYDCDLEARRLMEASDMIKESLCRDFGGACVRDDGSLDRGYIAAKVFSDAEALQRLNGLVHGCVREDVARWADSFPLAFVESAILHTSRLDTMCSGVWLVDAPESLRLERALARGGIDEDNLRRRMESQKEEFGSLPAEKVSVISNDGDTPLLPRLEELLAKLRT